MKEYKYTINGNIYTVAVIQNSAYDQSQFRG